jgi:hypothetical protein
MDLIHVDLTSADLTAAPEPIVVVPPSGEVTDVLDEGDEVVVSDRDGEFHGAVVVSVETSGDHAAYGLRIGARLPLDMAAQRLADVDIVPENRGLHEVVDLLGELRRSGGDPGLRPRP